jgi:hypothetical protein
MKNIYTGLKKRWAAWACAILLLLACAGQANAQIGFQAIWDASSSYNPIVGYQLYLCTDQVSCPEGDLTDPAWVQSDILSCADPTTQCSDTFALPQTPNVTDPNSERWTFVLTGLTQFEESLASNPVAVVVSAPESISPPGGFGVQQIVLDFTLDRPFRVVDARVNKRGQIIIKRLSKDRNRMEPGTLVFLNVVEDKQNTYILAQHG